MLVTFTAIAALAFMTRQDSLTHLTFSGTELVTLDPQRGRFELHLGPDVQISGHSEAVLGDGSVLSTAGASQHSVSTRRVRDKFGGGTETVVRNLAVGKPELRQTFRLLDGHELFVKLTVVGKADVTVNSLRPIVSEKEVRYAHRDPLHCLFVPYDNDNYFRYDSDNWGEGEGNGDGSYEVGSVYNDATRSGLVIGSIDHDTWKSAIRFVRDGQGEVSSVRAVAGVTSKYTHDVEPHGSVTGKTVDSPRFVVGWYADWRRGLERFGDLNAQVQPPLPWNHGVPFGWNSWSGHKDKVRAFDTRAATDFVKEKLPWFRSGGTAYINFDSFWDNLKPDMLAAFAAHAHTLGLKAGIYYTPFVAWGGLDDPIRRGDKFTGRDCAIKRANGEPLPRIDGGLPLDPTHPGTLERIDWQLGQFVEWGFDYVKLDFMTHGALEGKHYNPKITTGTQAYRYGMARIVSDLSESKIGRPFFISLSIAPMFPTGYAHSRRISCDIFANIGATEYFLNSANYAWWEANRLYRFSDPDSACVYAPLGDPPDTDAESRSRFTASAIGGGMMIDGDDLTKPAAQERVLQIYSNRELLEMAKPGIPFEPVFGDTGTKAGNTFLRLEPGGKTAYLAVFNVDKTKSLERSLTLSRLGLSGSWKSEELWTKTSSEVSGELATVVAPMDCAVFKLTKEGP